jgi:hypothetical protein
MLMNLKKSSHIGSPDYDAEITHHTPLGGELATYPRKFGNTGLMKTEKS